MKTGLFTAAFLVGQAAAFHSKASLVTGDVVDGEYVVQLKPDASLEKSLGAVFSMAALDKVGHIYGNFAGASFKGFSLRGCDVKAASMIADLPDLLLIEQSQIYTTNAVQTNPVGASTAWTKHPLLSTPSITTRIPQAQA